MLPFKILVSATVLARLVGLVIEDIDSWQWALRIGLAVMFMVTAMAHFHPKMRPGILSMVPEGLPARDALVTFTGFAEIAGSIGLLIHSLAPVAAICLAVLLVMMYPANVHASRLATRIGDYKTTPLIPRTVLQVVFIAALVLAAI